MLHKKQMHQLVCDIADINEKQWDNPFASFDPENAAAMLIEEALELIGAINPKAHAREFVQQVVKSPTTRVQRFDALIDSLYIVLGEFHKFGVRPDKLVDGLQIVHNKNKEKSGTKDANGKVIKPTDFVGPEEALQTLLDRP